MASIRAVSQMAPREPGASQWTSSTTRHSAVGARRHTASATVAGAGASSVVPWIMPAARSPRPALTAAITSRARTTPSASPWSRPIQASSPRGASRFSATAWASSVVLPRPGPPTTDVTRCSQRPSRARSSRGRVSAPGRGSGGSNRNERGMLPATLSRRRPPGSRTPARLASCPLIHFGHPVPPSGSTGGRAAGGWRPPGLSRARRAHDSGTAKEHDGGRLHGGRGRRRHLPHLDLPPRRRRVPWLDDQPVPGARRRAAAVPHRPADDVSRDSGGRGPGPAMTSGSLTEATLDAEDVLRTVPPGDAVPRALGHLADLEPRTLAVMHGSSFEGDGGAALRELARAWPAPPPAPAGGGGTAGWLGE